MEPMVATTGHTLRPSSSSNGILSDWMRDHPEYHGLKLSEFCFPGTHNSGTCDSDLINLDHTSFGPGTIHGQVLQLALKTNPCRVRKAVACLATCQPGSGSVHQQLVDGVRYIDLRVAYNKTSESFDIFHTFAFGRAEAAVDDIKRFLSEHSGEVVIVSVTPKRGFEEFARHAQLMSLVADRLDEFAFVKGKVPTDAGQWPTIGELIKHGQRSVLFYDGPVIGDKERGLWHEKNKYIKGGFFDTDCCETKQRYLTTLLCAHETSGEHLGITLFHLSYTLTPPSGIQAAQALYDWWSGKVSQVDGMERMAERMNGSLSDYLFTDLSQNDREKIGIITLDCQRDWKEMLLDLVLILLQERVDSRQGR